MALKDGKCGEDSLGIRKKTKSQYFVVKLRLTILALTSFLEHIMDSRLLVDPIPSLLASNNTILGDETEFAPKTMLFVG